MNISFDYFKLFYYVARYNNITKAAEQLSISRPAVAQELKKLEEQLNLTLFTRHSRGVHLTTEGEILFNKISPCIHGLLEAEELAYSLSSSENGTINIGCTRITILKQFQDILSSFHEQYPNIMVQSSIIPFNIIQNALDSGMTDLVIGSRFNYMKENVDGTLKKPTTIQRSLGIYDDVIIAHKHMKKILMSEVTLEILHNKYSFIFYRDHGMDDYLNTALRSDEAKEQDLFLSDFDTMLRLLKTSDSIAIIPCPAISNFDLDREFIKIDISGIQPQTEYIIHYSPINSPSLIAKKLIDYLIDHMT